MGGRNRKRLNVAVEAGGKKQEPEPEVIEIDVDDPSPAVKVETAEECPKTENNAKKFRLNTAEDEDDAKKSKKVKQEEDVDIKLMASQEKQAKVGPVAAPVVQKAKAKVKTVKGKAPQKGKSVIITAVAPLSQAKPSAQVQHQPTPAPATTAAGPSQSQSQFGASYSYSSLAYEFPRPNTYAQYSQEAAAPKVPFRRPRIDYNTRTIKQALERQQENLNAKNGFKFQTKIKLASYVFEEIDVPWQAWYGGCSAHWPNNPTGVCMKRVFRGEGNYTSTLKGPLTLYDCENGHIITNPTPVLRLQVKFCDVDDEDSELKATLWTDGLEFLFGMGRPGIVKLTPAQTKAFLDTKVGCVYDAEVRCDRPRPAGKKVFWNGEAYANNVKLMSELRHLKKKAPPIKVEIVPKTDNIAPVPVPLPDVIKNDMKEEPTNADTETEMVLPN